MYMYIYIYIYIYMDREREREREREDLMKRHRDRHCDPGVPGKRRGDL